MTHVNQGLIGTAFITGQKAPVSGVYTIVRHINPAYCCTTDDERTITLKQCEPFPSHCGCGKRVIWQLSQYSWVAAGKTCSFVANLTMEQPPLQTING